MARSRTPLPAAITKPAKRQAGRTDAAATPLNIRADGVRVTPAIEAYVRDRAGRKLGKFAAHVERVTVRFKDVNGPRGGVDTDCTMKIVVSGAPSVVVTERGQDARSSFDFTVAAASRALRREIETERAKGRLGGAARASLGRAGGAPRGKTPASRPNPPPPDGSLVGRRVGHAPENLRAAAARPEKRRRDALVDTAAPGVSASDRRAGGGSTARRNSRRDAGRSGAMLEDSAQARPSRKSTRKSSGRAKRDDPQRLRAVAATRSPTARATRASARTKPR